MKIVAGGIFSLFWAALLSAWTAQASTVTSWNWVAMPDLTPSETLTLEQALHFYLESNEQRCFLEELPSDTVVEGQHQFLPRNRKDETSFRISTP